jgi:hypothetical protein
MAGRYQGRHVFEKADGKHLQFEVFWQQSGWFWRTHNNGLDCDAVGPFTTSTEAYENATTRHARAFLLGGAKTGDRDSHAH